MKKTIITIILGLFGILILATPVLAASNFSFSLNSIITNPGKSFTLRITLNPQEVKNYTAKVEVSYPKDLLTVNSFTFGSNWMSLSQSGYDLVDNENGLLIKTAGYPGGISAPVTFGTVSFTAKKDGSGVIKTTNNSFVLDSANQNVLSGTFAQTSVVIQKITETPITPKVEEKPKQEKEIVAPEEEIVPEEETITEPKEVTEEEKIPQRGLLASLGMAVGEISRSALFTIVTILCLVGLVAIGVREWWLFRKKRKK